MYIATFFTHFGATSFHSQMKKKDSAAKLMPVPRALSASCGICVTYEVDVTNSVRANVPEDLEALYSFDGSSYTTLIEEADA